MASYYGNLDERKTRTLSASALGNNSAETRAANRKDLRRMQHNTHVSTHTWHGMAFIIEAVILLAFVAMAVAVFFRLFAYSENTSIESSELSSAVVAASNTAELFAQDPASMAGYSTTEGDYSVSCSVTPSDTEAGVLYEAKIEVYHGSDSEPLYTLTTSRYVSEGENDTNEAETSAEDASDGTSAEDTEGEVE